MASNRRVETALMPVNSSRGPAPKWPPRPSITTSPGVVSSTLMDSRLRQSFMRQ
jgi:hypothetical protein